MPTPTMKINLTTLAMKMNTTTIKTMLKVESRYHPDNHHPETNQPLPPNLLNEDTTQNYGSAIMMCEMVGRSLGPSLQIIDLGLDASEIEAKVKYRQLARIHHPDKNKQAETGLTTDEASEFFKLLNNANEYLEERMFM
jgi:hypothetical protein